MKYVYISIFMAMMVLLSCEKAVDNFELQNEKPQIVINGLAQQDSMFAFTISKTSMRNDYSYNRFLVNPSLITLKKNGQTVEVVWGESSRRYYAKDVIVQQKDIFDIEVEVNGLEPAKASVRIPDSVAMFVTPKSIRMQKPNNCVGAGCSQELTLNLAVTLDDPDEENYYAISVNGLFKGFVYSMETNTKEYYVYDEPLFFSSLDGIYDYYNDYNLYPVSGVDQFVSGRKLYFKDVLLRGLKNTLNLSVNVEHLAPDESGQCDVKVVLYSYSKEMYAYLRSIASYNQYGDSFLSEPIYILSNIENGHGILGGMNQTERTISIDLSEQML